MDFAKLKTNSSLEKDGVWFQYEDAKFLIARMGGDNIDRLEKANAKHLKKHAAAIRRNDLKIKQQKEISKEIFVDCCLLDWDNVYLEGEKLDYTRENAIKLFTDVPYILEVLESEANNIDNYKRDLEDLGNS